MHCVWQTAAALSNLLLEQSPRSALNINHPRRKAPHDSPISHEVPQHNALSNLMQGCLSATEVFKCDARAEDGRGSDSEGNCKCNIQWHYRDHLSARIGPNNDRRLALYRSPVRLLNKASASQLAQLRDIHPAFWQDWCFNCLGNDICWHICLALLDGPHYNESDIQ